MKGAITGDVLGIPVALVSRAELLREWEDAVRRGGAGAPFTSFYVNARSLLEAQGNREFYAALREGSLIYADGMGAVLAGRFLGSQIREKLTTTDVFPMLCDVAAQEGWRLFLLGARPGVGARAAMRLAATRPGLPAVAVRDGFWPEGGDEEVLAQVAAAKPHVLVVCLGQPLQELWVVRRRARLASVPLVLTGGGLLDFLSGDTPRGPMWMTRNGLEWVARLAVEPRRLWRRYLVGLPRLGWVVLRARLTSRRSSGGGAPL